MNLICDCGHLLVYAKQSMYDKLNFSPHQDMFYRNMGQIKCDKRPSCPKTFVHLRCSYCSKLHHKGEVVRVSVFDNRTHKEVIKAYKL